MSRPLRIEYEGAVYHVTARGNARQTIFSDAEDRERFLSLLAREIGQQGWLCHAYCLMDNHYHLLIETPEANLSKGMRRLNGTYSQRYNARHGRVGHLLQGRYKSILVEKESYLLELCRYIVNNPVAAGMTKSPADYPWSSYPATAGLATCPPWLKTDWVLAQFSSDNDAAVKSYTDFVSRANESCSPWSELKGQIWLGKEEFLRRMEALASESAPENIPDAQLRPTRPSIDTVLQQVAKQQGVSAEMILSRASKSGYRQAVYLLRRKANLSLKEVAQLFGISAGRVSQIQNEIEKTAN